MIAITTRYIGPSNTRGSRITAFAWSPEGRRQSVSVNYRHDCHGSDNYRDAAVAWVKRFAPACAVSAARRYAGVPFDADTRRSHASRGHVHSRARCPR
jgi:hypothetical protein